jgi:hypothetical protein
MRPQIRRESRKEEAAAEEEAAKRDVCVIMPLEEIRPGGRKANKKPIPPV